MSENSTKSASLQSGAEAAAYLFDDWFDPIEAGLRDRVREFIQGMIEGELEGNRSVKTPGHAAARSGSAGFQCQGCKSAIWRAG
jgi:hypothetical protein